MMDSVTKTTDGVKITVATEYQPEYSSPVQFHYVFAYKVHIENRGDCTVQLRNRKWFIHDANGKVRSVEGEGVAGQQPVLEPNESYEYVSGCNLKSGMGKMRGSYQMERIVDGSFFDVVIPEFSLIVPFKLN